MSLECTLAEGIIFKKVVDALKELVESAEFICTEKGLTLQAMDGAHVSLVALDVNRGLFDEYKCSGSLSLGVNIKHLAKLLKCMGSKDSLRLIAKEDSNVLKLIYQPQDFSRNSEFELKLRDAVTEELMIPDTTYDAVATVNSIIFQKIVKDMKELGDQITIRADDEGIKFSANGVIGRGSVCLPKGHYLQGDGDDGGSGVESKIEVVQETVLSYAVKYLTIFCKSCSLATAVTLRMSAKSPLVVEYAFSEYGSLRYFLAPKIEG